MPRPLRPGLVALVATLGLLITGCGSDEPSTTDQPSTTSGAPSGTPGSTPAAEPSASAPLTEKPTEKPSGTRIVITFKGDQVDPAGVERSVKAGEPITLHIVADAPGELHVHSSPEQQIDYPAGTTDKTLTIDQPGVVEVEAHDLSRLVVQLEVR